MVRKMCDRESLSVRTSCFDKHISYRLQSWSTTTNFQFVSDRNLGQIFPRFSSPHVLCGDLPLHLAGDSVSKLAASKLNCRLSLFGTINCNKLWYHRALTVLQFIVSRGGERCANLRTIPDGDRASIQPGKWIIAIPRDYNKRVKKSAEEAAYRWRRCFCFHNSFHSLFP